MKTRIEILKKSENFFCAQNDTKKDEGWNNKTLDTLKLFASTQFREAGMAMIVWYSSAVQSER